MNKYELVFSNGQHKFIEAENKEEAWRGFWSCGVTMLTIIDVREA